MGFNEKTHAFIPARYYFYLTRDFGGRGLRAFIHATRHYAMQRGARMAQRAIRDGRELTQETYNQYGEWLPTPEITAAGQQNKSVSVNGRKRIFRCPWKAMFDELGAGECRDVYCSVLDSAISRGFNPDLGYRVDTHPAEGICEHWIESGDIAAGAAQGRKKEYVRDFEYHCAHAFWSYREVCAAIFGAAGEEIAAKVGADFAERFGAEMAAALQKYRGENFNVCG